MKTSYGLLFLAIVFLGMVNGTCASSPRTLTGSPEEYYNEALAAKEQGDLPAASLALRRALILDPTLLVAQQEAQEVFSKMGLPIDSSWQQKLVERYSPEKITLVGMVIGWGATLGLVFVFFLTILSSTPLSTVRPKKWGFFFLMLFLCLLGHAISVLGVISDPRMHARYEVILLPKIDIQATQNQQPYRAATTPLRTTPADAASTIAQLPTGSCLILLSQHGDWSYVRTALGQEGWIPSGSLQFLIPRNATTNVPLAMLKR